MHSMRRRSLSVVLGVAALLAVTGVAIPSSAQAATRGTVAWSFTTSKVSAGTGIGVTYQPSGIQPGSLLTFERQFGTAKVWKAVANFHVSSSSSSTATLPGDPLGAYEYRVQVTTGHRITALTHDRPLYSYGSVTLLTLCNEGSDRSMNCSPGTVQLSNSTLYNYQASDSVDPDASPGQTDFAFGATSCRSGSLDIVVGFPSDQDPAFPGSSVTTQVAQSASDPQLITVPDSSQQTFDFNLDGGPFDLDSWYTTNGQDNWENIYVSGTFNCYTLNGLA
jgi:hypothetical protein